MDLDPRHLLVKTSEVETIEAALNMEVSRQPLSDINFAIFSLSREALLGLRREEKGGGRREGVRCELRRADLFFRFFQLEKNHYDPKGGQD